MDPYIEKEDWSDFHGALIFAMRSHLAPQLSGNYMVRAEQRIYLEHAVEEKRRFQPDLRITKRHNPQRLSKAAVSAAVAELEPELLDVPIPVEQKEYYLVIRDKENREVVTTLEVLSPSNKAPGSDGYREYYEKREELLCSRVHLVEIDLLRGGQRPSTIQPLKTTTDYCALVHRINLRPKAEVYQWTLRDHLPKIKIPLEGKDPDALLNLDEVFATAFDGGDYQTTLDYERHLKPSLRRSDVAWAKDIVAQSRRA